MKKIVFFMMFLTGMSVGVFNSCSSDDGGNASQVQAIQSDTVKNLYAENGYVKFSFSQGDTVPSASEDWDIAFNSTKIIVNGGTASQPFSRTGKGGLYVVKGLMSEIISADSMQLKFDTDDALALTTGSGNGWYTYDMTQHIISPIAGVIIVVRTHDGRYAKMEIDSYYKDAPQTVPAESEDYGYYTFDYVYQPNKGKTDFSN